MSADERTTGAMPAGEDPAGTGAAADAAPVDEAAEAPAPESAEAAAENVEHDLEALREQAGKADEYLDMARRAQADFDNFRKRAARDAAAGEERGIGRLARELIPALDNLDHALAAIAALPADDPAQGVAKGFTLVRDELLAGLARCGVSVDSPLGEQFDPQRHEAVAQVQHEDAQANSVVEVHQSGYLLGETVLRAARVSVSG